MQSLRDGRLDSLQSLELPAFRQLMVLRLLAVADARLCDWNRRDLGDFAQLGLWLLDGMNEGAAREAVKMPWGKAADVVFDRLLRALPDALMKRDRHGIIEGIIDGDAWVPLRPPQEAYHGCHAAKFNPNAARLGPTLLPLGSPQRH